MNFCTQCGEKLSYIIPHDDDRARYVCDACGHIHYQNPLIVVVTIPCHEDKVLMCKRAIEPRYGRWTLPGGFMENDETTHEGALRETREEANARVRLHDIYTLYSLPHINQVHLFFRSELLDLDFSAGDETMEVKLFSEEEIPWDEIAFMPVQATLEHYFRDRKKNHFPMHCGEVKIDPSTEKHVLHPL
tara:strand:- start:4303 stop:4869 length:567 start_codon:yes stop_codon:yes gene_type:complete